MAGRIQLSDNTYRLLLQSGATKSIEWIPTGGVEVKGKGVMETYLWNEAEAVLLMSATSNHVSAASNAVSHDATSLLESGVSRDFSPYVSGGTERASFRLQLSMNR